ncbi:uncharacterized protein G2W53_008001 [Senna tora]|uniref:Uncharacterized protein n=1 Tax=Senna tora TaxID=362788 RepID=A0A835CET4_9FABA|nr:uncharacterized protein G2W53_008001 [Senna tora]
MASSALVMRTTLDSNDTIYSYNESPTHHFIKEEPNDADSDETPYCSDKEATPEVNPYHHPIPTSPLAHINVQLEEIHGPSDWDFLDSYTSMMGFDVWI